MLVLSTLWFIVLEFRICFIFFHFWFGNMNRSTYSLWDRIFQQFEGVNFDISVTLKTCIFLLLFVKPLLCISILSRYNSHLFLRFSNFKLLLHLFHKISGNHYLAFRFWSVEDSIFSYLNRLWLFSPDMWGF